MTTIAIYPGSFDPVTNGHLDIIMRAAKFVDKLIVSVSANLNKNPMFSVSERVELLGKVTKDIPNVEIDSMDGLLVNYVRKKEAKLIIKGLRAVSDFEYEFLMALINRNLEPDIETLFLSASTQYQYLSSSAVKEVAFYGGNIDGLVPKEIQGIIIDKICNKKYLK